MNEKIKKKQIAGMNLMYKWYSLEYFFDAMEELGFESVSIWGGPPHFDCDYMGYQECKKVRQQVERRGLSVEGFLVTGSNYRYQMAEQDKSQREHVFQYFRNGILACEEMGSPYMSVNSGWGYWDCDREDAFCRSSDMLLRLCEEGEKHHVSIAMESLKACESNLVVTLEDTRRMFDKVNHPWFQIMADTGAIVYNGERLEDWFQCFGDKIGAIHFVDGMHLAWGDGKSPLDDMVFSIMKHRYQGCLALETSGGRYLANPKEADRKAITILSRFTDSWI